MTARRPANGKQVILGASFPGVNHHTVWGDPRAGSQIAIESFVHLAKTAERGRFDFFFQAEGLRVREHKGRFYELDIAGRPHIAVVQAALAGVTQHLGFLATINTTFNEPYDLARQLATLNHLSDGRTGWNVVTTSDAFHGENFRRGGYLPRGERYERAAEFVRTALELWDSWPADSLGTAGGEFVTDPGAGRFAHHGKHFDIEGTFPVPTAPQRHPVLVQAGVSDEGREFAARTVDAIFSPFGEPGQGREFYADVKGRARRAGRDPDTLKILPGASFVLGDTPGEAAERAREVALAQVTPATALALLEQTWLRDLSDHDPDGPVPPVEADGVEVGISRGRTTSTGDPLEKAREWYAYAREHRLSIRELVIARAHRAAFAGTPLQVAQRINDAVQTDAADGFVIGSHLVPYGLDEFVDKVVPFLQEWGVLRTEYTPGATFRENLGLPPQAPGARPGVRPFDAAEFRPETAGAVG
ncbi:NtaA/DmoA family FMN-dependent monooxygenase [Occultella kanbiaonis]|uniref:NtaA/DmoA family FMN-dependent monooxygenase n=1 Tax=Occultella kanbiaonis TaxID=2675754 RepID=UPI0012BA1A68|nr:NtaA/DmoA family FMN-dependent monooxygenase [Occultella kanbiaonis]